jgi:putative restriction endonuclease
MWRYTLASLIRISNTSWRQPFADRKREFHLWSVQPHVRDYCDFKDGTKRLLWISFDEDLRADLDVLDYFQITSGKEISFPKALQEVIKPIVIGNPNSYFVVTVMDAEVVPPDSPPPSTEGAASIKTRVGQQQFRKKLMDYWGGCALSGLSLAAILKASHIKPWRISDDVERLDHFNGLLLSPNFDALFDKGFISFDDDGGVLLSNSIRKLASEVGLHEAMRLRKIEDEHKKYLRIHREMFGFSPSKMLSS